MSNLLVILMALMMVLLVSSTVKAEESFKAVDTVNPELYFTVAEGWTWTDPDTGEKYRYMYVPWGTEILAEFVYSTNPPKEEEKWKEKWMERSKEEIKEIINFLEKEKQELEENQPKAYITIDAFRNVIEYFKGGLLVVLEQ